MPSATSAASDAVAFTLAELLGHSRPDGGEPRCPVSHKRQYVTEVEAQAALRRLIWSGDCTDAQAAHIYACDKCLRFHVGTSRPTIPAKNTRAVAVTVTDTADAKGDA